jgi:hypothetical protein
MTEDFIAESAPAHASNGRSSKDALAEGVEVVPVSPLGG